MTRMTHSVEGMSCTGCEESVEDALAEIDGISTATADHKTGTVEVETSDDVSDERIQTAVEDAGYQVINV